MLRERLVELAGPVVEAAGCELVDIVTAVERRRGVLRVFIDRPGGVTIEDCAAVSRELAAVLDVEDLIPGSYDLEVSSPGLDRALRKEEDFRRFAGRRVKVRTVHPLEGRSNFRALLEGVEDGMVLLRDDSGRAWRIGLENIRRANLIPEL